MFIERIFLCPPAASEQQAVRDVVLVAGKGIAGDRYYDRHEEPGQNITLVEAEEIETFNAANGTAFDLGCTRRNVVTRGVRLNALIGQEFMLGGVRLRGVELCEPCMGLGERLASDGLQPAKVVKQFLHKAGIRADVLSDGTIAVGDRLSLLP
ncbi:MOSC domain-containing protein [Chitinimonas naiadis]